MRACYSTPPGHAKGLPTTEILPTPTGSVTVGEVEVGDYIFGTDGKPTRVLAKSEVFNKPCFRAITSDGEELIVTDDHLWTIHATRGRPAITKTTKEFYEWHQKQKNKRAFLLPKIEPVKRPEQSFTISPYLLGVWLGDGSKDCARVYASHVDRPFMMEQFTREGWNVHEIKSPAISFTIHGFYKHIRVLGLDNNKHIPDVYMNASVEQRLELVRGLMDTDGNCRDNGGCRFTNTNEQLIDQLRELLWSLGVPNSKTLTEDGSRICDKGYKRSPCWVVSFSGLDCFRIPRKRERLVVCKKRYGRYITFVPCAPVPTQCIAVDAPDELFLVGRSYIPTHNTKFFTRYGPAWYLGRNPNHRYLQGGHSQSFAENEFGKYVRDIILTPEYSEVFKNVSISAKSSAAGNWRLSGGRGGYVTKGVGQSIAGFRGHMGGIDDPFGSREDANSPAVRTKTGNWLFTDFRTRLLPLSPLFIVATRWHPEDLIGLVEKLNKEKRGLPWQIYNLPALVETEAEMAMDPMGRSMGEALWPEYYGLNELLELKATLPSSDWFALYKGQPRDIEGNAVKTGWFQRYSQLPYRGAPGSPRVNEVRRVTLSVDCANKTTARSAYTVITVWYEDFQRRHYLADVVRKKMEFMDMVKAIHDTAARWHANLILVEDQGSGVQYINQYRGKAPAPIVPIEVNNKDKEFRFDGVIPTIEAGEVFLPVFAFWLAEYEHELLSFPDSTYKDQVDSTSQYLTYARRRGKYGSRKLKGVAHA